MSLNKNSKALLNLANSIGDFIRYWGFRRIHGQIWTMVYLSEKPLSGADLVSALKVSKALISPAIRELEAYRLIEQVRSENSKTKRYIANPDIFGVIREVLLTRETEIFHRIKSNFELLQKQSSLETSDELDPKRVQELKDMIRAANGFLQAVVKVQSGETLKGLVSLMGKF